MRLCTCEGVYEITAYGWEDGFIEIQTKKNPKNFK